MIRNFLKNWYVVDSSVPGLLRTFQSFQLHPIDKSEIKFDMFTETEDIDIDRWISLSTALVGIEDFDDVTMILA